MAALSRKRKDCQEAWNYETTVSKIEEILTLIESGDLDLADVFEQFSVAVEYLKQCDAFLQDRQQAIELLVEILSSESGS
jgi:exodeoxyribonuclease VII small subunit